MFPPELDYFLVTATEGSIARAAAKLGISQPALTKAMQRLERRVGVKLFERTARGSELTESGEAFYRRTVALAGIIDDAVEEARDLGSSQSGLLRIGMTPGVTDFVVASLFPRLPDERPAASFKVSVGFGDVLLSGLLSSRHSLIVCPTMADLPEDVKQEFLYREDFYIVARKGHRLTQLERVQLGDLVDYRWAASTSHEVGRMTIEQAFTAQNLPAPTGRVEADSLSAILAIIAQTDMISAVTSSRLRFGRLPDCLAALPVEELQGIRSISMIVRQGYIPSVALRAAQILRERAQAFASQLPD